MATTIVQSPRNRKYRSIDPQNGSQPLMPMAINVILLLTQRKNMKPKAKYPTKDPQGNLSYKLFTTASISKKHW